ncbi:ABC transporter ATP-binding protein [Paenibacillus arenilitoris]|uniref:ABC transporter ATP-binding protein n=1 Tax=Paenibacillus arenilitoris TaxID=2772299 RepID=A0A927CK63_9BACL|nr:ABC transporter ATP-binding protein [Paenibacillus arenilitoris]MBD2867175.1 ABC transporter ATP-binding protein [Paenibacillus arenilitoris]
MERERVLEVKDAAKRFRNGRGIKGVSLELSRGDVYGLFGPNGAGKTTLLKLITGLIRPDRGTVHLFGKPAATRFEEAMSRVGCVIESADAYEFMSAYDNLKLAARFYPGIAAGRIDQALEEVGLAPYKKEKAGGFSLGMKQRLALAAALLPGPELVILDEPTNGLDIEGMVDIRRTIERLAREQGIAFIISSHMIGDMEKLVNRFGILQGGELIRQERLQDLLPEGTTLEQYYMAQIQSKKEADAYA